MQQEWLASNYLIVNVSEMEQLSGRVFAAYLFRVYASRTTVGVLFVTNQMCLEESNPGREKP